MTPGRPPCSSAGITAGLVGVIAIPFTPFATMSWIAAISPASSVAALPCAKLTLTFVCVFARSWRRSERVKKKSTGNFVMKPSLTDAEAFAVAGFAVAVTDATAAALAMTRTRTVTAASRFLLMFVLSLGGRLRPQLALSVRHGASSPCSSERGAARCAASGGSWVGRYAPPPTISETISECVSALGITSPTLRPRRMITARSQPRSRGPARGTRSGRPSARPGAGG